MILLAPLAGLVIGLAITAIIVTFAGRSLC